MRNKFLEEADFLAPSGRQHPRSDLLSVAAWLAMAGILLGQSSVVEGMLGRWSRKTYRII